ncbi:MAG: hypothetical protein U9R48_07460 [Chloroflexota bacterium]|nr:hypothetical protein [Chloroflexota bacterium]
MKITLAEIDHIRDLRYHRTSARRVHTEQEALNYVNEIGFCFLFGEQGVEMPTLWAAVCGEERPVPRHRYDPDKSRTWKWKDTLPSKGAIHYGKVLRRKPTLVSLEMLPHFYALSPNYGDLYDYIDQYESGHLSVEAKQIYEALLEGGVLSTTKLRRAAGLSGSDANARRFDRGIAELQMELKIAKVGISRANRWRYAYVYDLFPRQFPEVVEAAREISTDEARETLLTRYLHNVVAQPEGATRRIFHWHEADWERALTRLAERGIIKCGQSIKGIGEDCLVLPPSE